MTTTAFTAPVGLRGAPFTGDALRRGAMPVGGGRVRMSVADVYIAESAVRSAKQAGAPGGVFWPQCTEGAARGSAESSRVRTLSREFRLRQASASERFADLYATRREALCRAGGQHFAETEIAKFPATAGARVRATREAALACDRYFGADGAAADYMHMAVVRQYHAALGAPGGVYSTACADAAAKDQAEEARVAALAVQFRAGVLDARQKTARRYNAALDAIVAAKGWCSYEETQFLAFPKMAAAMKGFATGAYAAAVGGAVAMGGMSTGKSLKVLPLAVRLQSEVKEVIWRNSDIRKGIERKLKVWERSPLKDYSPMSRAAVEFGIEAQSNPYVVDKYHPDRWVPGWQPKNVTMREYA